MQLLQSQDHPRRIELRRSLRDPIVGDDCRQGPCKPRLEHHAHGARVGRPAEEAGNENGRREREHEGALAQDLRLALAGRHAGLGEALEGEDAAWNRRRTAGMGSQGNTEIRDMGVHCSPTNPRHLVLREVCKVFLMASTGDSSQHCGGGRHECSNVDRTTSLPVLCLRIPDSGKKGSTRREQPCDSAQVRWHAVQIGLPKILNLYWTVLSAFVTYFSETEYLST
jgi:hypothetical protein